MGLPSFKFHLYNALCTFDVNKELKITQVYLSAECAELMFVNVRKKARVNLYLHIESRDSTSTVIRLCHLSVTLVHRKNGFC